VSGVLLTVVEPFLIVRVFVNMTHNIGLYVVAILSKNDEIKAPFTQQLDLDIYQSLDQYGFLKLENSSSWLILYHYISNE
jgi:hypothetical protein